MPANSHRDLLSSNGQSKHDNIVEQLLALGETQSSAEKYAQRLTRAAVSRRLFNSKQALKKGLP